MLDLSFPFRLRSRLFRYLSFPVTPSFLGDPRVYRRKCFDRPPTVSSVRPSYQCHRPVGGTEIEKKDRDRYNGSTLLPLRRT